MRVAEGIPSDVPAEVAWDAMLARREVRRNELQALGLSFLGALGAAFGGKVENVIMPFYTRREWEEITADKAEREQIAAQMNQARMLERMMRHGR